MHQFKFPSIQEEYDGSSISGKDIFIYEKIDGGNVSFRRDGSRVVPWSRGGPIGRDNKYFFPAFRQFVFEILAPEIYQLPENLIPFGEFPHAGAGHISYDLKHINRFFLISVYDAEKDLFLPPPKSQQALGKIGLMNRIKVAPLLRRGSLTKGIAGQLVKKSYLYDGPCEGVVIHEYGDEYPHGVRMRKYYHPQFREYDDSKAGINRYLTLRRLIKAGQGVLGSGDEVTLDAIVEGTIKDVEKEIGSLFRDKIKAAMQGQKEIIMKEVLPLF